MYFDFTFVDMDECTLKTDACNQRCINKEGSYLCSCEDGFVLNGTTTCQSMYFLCHKAMLSHILEAFQYKLHTHTANQKAVFIDMRS